MNRFSNNVRLLVMRKKVKQSEKTEKVGHTVEVTKGSKINYLYLKREIETYENDEASRVS